MGGLFERASKEKMKTPCKVEGLEKPLSRVISDYVKYYFGKLREGD
jgi:hypothetical protein